MRFRIRLYRQLDNSSHDHTGKQQRLACFLNIFRWERDDT